MSDILLLIGGMALVTYLPRALPLILLSSRTLPEALLFWLELVPPAVLAALLVPALVLGKENGVPVMALSFSNIYLLAAAPTIATAWLTRNFFGTVAVGMGTAALLRALMG